MSQVKLKCVVKGKVRGTLSTTDTRGLIPQPSVLEIASRVLMHKMNACLDARSEREGVRMSVLGCGKGSQTRDMLFSLSQALEKGRDFIINVPWPWGTF